MKLNYKLVSGLTPRLPQKVFIILVLLDYFHGMMIMRSSLQEKIGANFLV